MLRGIKRAHVQIGNQHDLNRHSLRDFTLSMSIKPYRYRMSCGDASDLLHRADQALYEAKAHGRDQLKPFEHQSSAVVCFES